MYHLTVDAPRFGRGMILGLALGGAWCMGLSLGLWAACFYGGAFSELSMTAGCAVPSFLDACVVTMLPLFLSAFAVFFFHRAGAILVCAVRGITIGFMLGCFVLAGGFWLGLLLLFSGLCGSPVLLWYLWRRLFCGTVYLWKDVCRCLTAAVLIAAVDTWGIAPFLAQALSF